MANTKPAKKPAPSATKKKPTPPAKAKQSARPAASKPLAKKPAAKAAVSKKSVSKPVAKSAPNPSAKKAASASVVKTKAKPAVKKAVVAKKPAPHATSPKLSTKSAKPLAKPANRTTSKPSTPHVTKKATPPIMASKKPSLAKPTNKPAAKQAPETKKAKPASKHAKDANAGVDISSALEAKLVKLGRSKGGLSYDDLNKHLPADEFSPEIIDDLITRLAAKGVKLVEQGETDDKSDAPFAEGDDDAPATPGEGGEGDMVIEVEPEKEEESYGRSDDPVRMYLREMGNVELLSREGEIEIAKRIESGREMVISSLCESPTVMHMVLGWRDRLAGSEMLLREMIDLDATYGAGTADKFADAERNAGRCTEEVEEEEEDEYDALEGGRKEKVEEDEYDDEAVLSLVAMEQELLPAVLEKLDAFAKVSKALRKLQEKRHADGARRRAMLPTPTIKNIRLCSKETVEIMLSIRFNNARRWKS